MATDIFFMSQTFFTESVGGGHVKALNWCFSAEACHSTNLILNEIREQMCLWGAQKDLCKQSPISAVPDQLEVFGYAEFLILLRIY